MIRRGSGDAWRLISQVDHAHLAGEVAAVWVGLWPGQPVLERELREAVRDHDLGWERWEEAPRIDPATGVPRSFTEMPMTESTLIWRESIAGVEAHGSWAAEWVSRHFCFLAERAREARDDPEDQRAIARFLAEQAEWQQGWAAGRAGGVEIVDEAATSATGLRWLQFFDAMSLWLCCDEPAAIRRFDLPDGRQLTCHPVGQGVIELEPYPLAVSQLVLELPAAVVPARPFADDVGFRMAWMSAAREQLRWTLVPG